MATPPRNCMQKERRREIDVPPGRLPRQGSGRNTRGRRLKGRGTLSGKDRHMALFHTILHPTDFDAPSKEAFRVARALAASLGAKVVAFHIAPPPAVLTGEGQVIL